MPPAEGCLRMEEGARKALALVPGFGGARYTLAARRFWCDWDWAGAEQDFREILGVTEGPGVGIDDFRVFALLLWSSGRTEEAASLMERARRFDPGNLAYIITTADYLKKAGKLKEAAGLYRAAMETEPSDFRAPFGLAETLRREGDMPGAIAALRKAYELSDEEDGVRALAKARTEEDYATAQLTVARLRLSDLEALARKRYVSPLELARLDAELGERDKAFAYLEAALEEHSPGLVLLKVDTAWDRIRDDPRFAALVRKVGIP